jgi:3-oxoacyl-[acyl-carrier protein] reductase
MDLQLKGKRALVMGSSAGIGRAIAESLIAEGAQVVLCARSNDKLQTAVRELGAKSGIACDLSKAGAAKDLVQKASDALGGIDILVANTGGPKKGNFTDISTEQWHEDFQNLWMSFIESAKEVLPSMRKQKFGRILLVTSLAAKEPLAGLTTSNGLRAGLAGLAKSLANEVAIDNVTVNLLLPGYTATDRLKDFKFGEDWFKQNIPAGRLGDPKEIADLACFLASPRAGYITGQSIAVDGGSIKGH